MEFGRQLIIFLHTENKFFNLTNNPGKLGKTTFIKKNMFDL